MVFSKSLERCKGHTHKGHREKVLNVMNFWIFQGVFGVFSGCFEVFSGSFSIFQGVFRVFFPMPFSGMPFGPFQQELASWVFFCKDICHCKGALTRI